LDGEFILEGEFMGGPFEGGSGAAAGAGGATAGGGGGAGVESVRQCAERAADVGGADGVGDGPAVLDGVEEPGAGEELEVAGDDREVDGAALGDLGDGAGPGALRETGDKTQPGRVGEGFEEIGLEKVVDRALAGGGVPRGGGRAFNAYLRHHASIAPAAP
jgi:hypothetical protein